MTADPFLALRRQRAREDGVEDVCIMCEGPDPDHDACDRDGGYAHDDLPYRCACWALNHVRPGP